MGKFTARIWRYCTAEVRSSTGQVWGPVVGAWRRLRGQWKALEKLWGICQLCFSGFQDPEPGSGFRRGICGRAEDLRAKRPIAEGGDGRWGKLGVLSSSPG